MTPPQPLEMSILSNVFYECLRLMEIHLSPTITMIRIGVFSGCSSLAEWVLWRGDSFLSLHCTLVSAATEEYFCGRIGICRLLKCIHYYRTIVHHQIPQGLSQYQPHIHHLPTLPQTTNRPPSYNDLLLGGCWGRWWWWWGCWAWVGLCELCE